MPPKISGKKEKPKKERAKIIQRVRGRLILSGKLRAKDRQDCEMMAKIVTEILFK